MDASARTVKRFVAVFVKAAQRGGGGIVLQSSAANNSFDDYSRNNKLLPAAVQCGVLPNP